MSDAAVQVHRDLGMGQMEPGNHPLLTTEDPTAQPPILLPATAPVAEQLRSIETETDNALFTIGQLMGPEFVRPRSVTPPPAASVAPPAASAGSAGGHKRRRLGPRARSTGARRFPAPGQTIQVTWEDDGTYRCLPMTSSKFHAISSCVERTQACVCNHACSRLYVVDQGRGSDCTRGGNPVGVRGRLRQHWTPRS